MHYRNDAGLAAAELSLFVEKSVLATGAMTTVQTWIALLFQAVQPCD